MATASPFQEPAPHIGVRGSAGSGWRTVGAAMVTLALGPSAILIMCFGVFLPALHADLGWPVPRIALGASIISIAIMILSPVQGWLTDRIGGRRLVLIFVPIWAAGLGLMALLPARLPVFYAACFLLPFCGLGLWPLSSMKVVTGWFDRRLGLALGMTNVGLSLGSVGLPLLLGTIFAHGGWRVAYLALAGLVVVFVWPAAAIALREAERDTAVTAPTVGIGLREARDTRAFWLMLLSFPLVGAVSTGLLVSQSSILIDAGLAPGRAIALQAATGIGSTVARIGTGWLLDRIHVKWVGMAMFLIAAAACTMLASPAIHALALPAACLVGLVVGAEFDILGVLIRRYQGMRAFGRIYGIIFSIFQLGAAIGAAGLSLWRSRSGSYGLGLEVLAALSVAGAFLFALLGRYRFASTSPSSIPSSRSGELL